MLAIVSLKELVAESLFLSLPELTTALFYFFLTTESSILMQSRVALTAKNFRFELIKCLKNYIQLTYASFANKIT